MTEKPGDYPVATFAGGCFWCVESEFRPLDGVVYTRVGYSGGHAEDPTYEQISTGTTGHAEAVEIHYDPARVRYDELALHFMTRAHDPTQQDQQWMDKGSQYRSVIFYHDDSQKQAAEALIQKLTTEKHFKRPIVTALMPAEKFWEAEAYHQQYYEKYEASEGTAHIRTLLKKKRKFGQ